MISRISDERNQTLSALPWVDDSPECVPSFSARLAHFSSVGAADDGAED